MCEVLVVAIPNINTDEISFKMAVYGSIFELDRIGDEWNSYDDKVILGYYFIANCLSTQEKKVSTVQ